METPVACCGAAELLELGDPLCELDSEFRIVRVNAAHERIHRHRREDMLGRSQWEIWPETAHPESAYWREYHRCMAERVRVEFHALHAPLGVWTSVVAQPTSTGGIVIYWRDVTEHKRTEAARREAEQRLRTIFEHSRDGINLFDLTTARFAAISPAQAAMTGFTEEELVGLSPVEALERVHPDDRAIPAAHQQALAAGEDVPSTVEYRWRVKSGEYRWFSDHRTVVRDEAGRPVAMVGVSRDVTERRRTEEELRASEARLRTLSERFHAALEASPVVVFTQDRDLRYTWIANPALGYQADEVLGTTDYDLFERREDAVALEAMKRRVLAGGPAVREVVPVQYQGVVRWYDMSVRPQHRDGEVVGIIATAVDVTDRKQAEERLRDADRHKSEFIAVLSHELRNPLAPIRNGLLLLERSPAGSPAAGRALDILKRQTDQLCRLVDDLLDLTRITHGKVELQRVRLDARDAVRQACEDARAVSERHGVVLRFTDPAEPLWVEADRLRLAQMVGNLLGNAVKFTPSGGTVEVTARASGAACEIEVRDSGRGIAARDLERIFEPFVQAHDRFRGGLGIGLALVQDLVKRHGGSVRAESDGPGTGARFVLQLPRAEAPGRAAGGPQKGRGLRPLSILVVEDNVDAAMTLAEILTLDGHEVSVVHSAREGIEAARRHPDVLLCDIGLPDLRGDEVIRAVRSERGGRDIFTIALTGFAQSEDRREALAAGFDAHLPKPPPLGALQELLAAADRRRSEVPERRV